MASRRKKRPLTLEEHIELGRDVQKAFYIYANHINKIYDRFPSSGIVCQSFRKVHDELILIKSELDDAFFKDHPDQPTENSPYYMLTDDN